MDDQTFRAVAMMQFYMELATLHHVIAASSVAQQILVDSLVSRGQREYAQQLRERFEFLKGQHGDLPTRTRP